MASISRSNRGASTSTMQSNGKRYPKHSGSRKIVTTFVNKKGGIIKVTKATTIERALSRVVINMYKYKAYGASISTMNVYKSRADVHYGHGKLDIRLSPYTLRYDPS